MLPNTTATCHVWPMSTWNEAMVTMDLNFLFCLILRNLHLQLNNHMWPVSTLLDSAAPKGSNGQLLCYLYRPLQAYSGGSAQPGSYTFFSLPPVVDEPLDEHSTRIRCSESLLRSWANDREAISLQVDSGAVGGHVFSTGWEKQRRPVCRERRMQQTWRKQEDKTEGQNPGPCSSLWFQSVPKTGLQLALQFCDTLLNSFNKFLFCINFCQLQQKKP